MTSRLRDTIADIARLNDVTWSLMTELIRWPYDIARRDPDAGLWLIEELARWTDSLYKLAVGQWPTDHPAHPAHPMNPRNR